MILDTLEQNDNRGEHHGADLHLHHHRIALEYGSCGGEVFNTIRALDVLAADPAVDAGRIGITGVSGGGAMSLFAAALDQRIRAVSTLCQAVNPGTLAMIASHYSTKEPAEVITGAIQASLRDIPMDATRAGKVNAALQHLRELNEDDYRCLMMVGLTAIGKKIDKYVAARCHNNIAEKARHRRKRQKTTDQPEA